MYGILMVFGRQTCTEAYLMCRKRILITKATRIVQSHDIIMMSEDRHSEQHPIHLANIHV